MNCPHCGAGLLPHEGTKAGYAHCNSCGCCMDASGQLRPGTSGCRNHIQPDEPRLTGRDPDEAPAPQPNAAPSPEEPTPEVPASPEEHPQITGDIDAHRGPESATSGPEQIVAPEDSSTPERVVRRRKTTN